MQHPQDLIRKARVLESAGQYEAALDAYVRIIDSADEPETHLLARAGVLQLRLGQVDEAARTLARACDRYADAGLQNNALALCHRLIRADPARTEFHRRIAELAGLLGYPEDARFGCTRYADALAGAGDAEAAADALRAHLRHFPDDDEVQTRLATLGAVGPAPTPPEPREVAAPRYATAADDLGLLTNMPEDADPAELGDLSRPTADADVLPLEGLEATRMEDERAQPAEDVDADLPLLGNTPDPGGADAPEPHPAGGPEDPESFYDLGVAFKEMGLWDDAIGQLQDALRAGARPLATLEVLGECYLGKGEPGLATRVLDRAAQIATTEPRELLGVHYWLGRAHEAAAAARPARDCYRRVLEIDPDFRDAAARVAALEPA